MRDTAEIATLRTMLKKVNVEYSTALRGTDHDAKPLKLDALRKQRLALMYRIARVETAPERPHFAGLERGCGQPTDTDGYPDSACGSSGHHDWPAALGGMARRPPSRSNDGANGVARTQISARRVRSAKQ